METNPESAPQEIIPDVNAEETARETESKEITTTTKSAVTEATSPTEPDTVESALEEGPGESITETKEPFTSVKPKMSV